MDALEVAAGLCRHFEGLSLTPYLCPAGVPTIGYGSTRMEDGSPVTMTTPAISAEHAETMLWRSLATGYAVGILKASPGLLAHPAAFGALISFAYNLGVPRYRASTLRRRVDAEDWVQARSEIKRWNLGGGRVLPGLVRRREAEALLLVG